MWLSSSNFDKAIINFSSLINSLLMCFRISFTEIEPFSARDRFFSSEIALNTMDFSVLASYMATFYPPIASLIIFSAYLSSLLISILDIFWINPDYSSIFLVPYFLDWFLVDLACLVCASSFLSGLFSSSNPSFLIISLSLSSRVWQSP